MTSSLLQNHQLRWPTDWADIFDCEAPLIIEIGFGSGHFLVDLAQRRPSANVLGVEISLPALDKAQRKVRTLGLENVRLLQSGNQYQPELDVTYTVANETYSSRQRPVSPNGQAKGSKAWAREFSLQFKPGTAVPLYYNPTQPKRATMSPKQMNASSSQTQLTSIIMIVIAVGLHLLGARGLIANFLNLSGSSVLVTMIITTIVSLLLGGALGLLVQDLRQPKT